MATRNVKSDQARLHPELERWARDQGWDNLHWFQQEAVASILETNCDLIISASTSAGKTEAAYLPLLTQAAGRTAGVSVLCLSPTKALINDQLDRIVTAAARVGVPVFAWHGDVSQARKSSLMRGGIGVVIMTIESLEGRFIRHPQMIADLFSNLDAIVIDEFHEFLGGARGAQLGSLLARLDDLVAVTPRRIALSATIPDVAQARRWLRPQEPRSIHVITGPNDAQDLRSCVRGYAAPDLGGPGTSRAMSREHVPVAIREIEASIFERLRGGTHLVFAGSRSIVENLCDGLARRCERARVQNAFLPHHGSMAKQARRDVEMRLRAGEQLTVLTTTTLALGLDIGSIDSVEVLGPPLSLADFRQKIGRSGRRSAPPVVDVHVTERPFASAIKLSDRLRLATVRACAALNLLEQRYIEPREDDGATLSVVVQQVLSNIKQRGGANLPQLQNLIDSVAAFSFVTAPMFRQLVEHLASADQALIEEGKDGRYVLTEKGEQLVHGAEFYAAFQTTDQWDVVAHGIGKVGQISLSNPLAVGDRFRLSGSAWEVKYLDLRHYRVIVVPASSGSVPIFDASPLTGVDERIAREMRIFLQGSDTPGGLNASAARHLEEGRATFRQLSLDHQNLVADGDLCHLVTWRGTRFNTLLAAVLRYKGYGCSANEVAVTVAHNSREVGRDLSIGVPSLDELSEKISSLWSGKHDRKIPIGLLRQYWVKRHADLEQSLRAFCGDLHSC